MRRRGDRFQLTFPIRNPRQQRRGEYSDSQPRFSKLLHRREPQVRPRSTRLEQPRQPRPQRCHRDVQVQRGPRRNPPQHIDVTHDLIRFRRDRNAQSLALCQLFKARPRHAILAFRRLVRVRRRSNRDVLRLLPSRTLRRIRILVRDVVRQQRPRVLLNKNLALEIRAVQLHVLVCVPRIAVAAAKFAAAVRIDRPFKRNALRIAPVKDRPHRQQEILRTFP